MAKILEETPNQNTNFTENLNNNFQTSPNNGGFDNSTFKETANQNNQAPKADLVDTLTSFLPLAPMFIEKFTGRKIPAIGSIADIQVSLNNLALSLQSISVKQNQLDSQQQQIFAKVANLEQNANQQLINLNSKLQNWRLTHEREKKQIEYNAKSSETEE